MIFLRRILISFLFIITGFWGFSQGCSDAGFCTMGAMKPDQHYSKAIDIKLRSIGVGQYIGLTRFQDVILVYTSDVTIGINEKTGVQIKLPYQFTFGSLANTNGIGDISLSATHRIVSTSTFDIMATVGTKLPTGQDDKSIDGKPLAMYYQPGLGTYDIIFGASLLSRKWLVSFGYQQALNKNDNEFKWGPWVGTDREKEALRYPTSVKLKRGIDVMNRVERNFRFANYNFNIGLLTIYRINKDTRISPQTGERVEADKSNGPAITLLTGFGYHFSVKSSIKIGLGFRLVKREINPDGLSREFVNTLEYVYKF